jgi:hypothetical protein
MKVCSKCEIEKDVSQFFKDKQKSDGLYSQCKLCKYEKNRVWNANNRDRVVEGRKNYYQKNKEALKQKHKKYDKEYRARNKDRYYEKSWEKSIKANYGISKEVYERMLTSQNNCCAVCKSDIPGTFQKRFAVDHDHVTGRVRGLLCMWCNTALGKFKDDEALLLAAVDYLRRSHD